MPSDPLWVLDTSVAVAWFFSDDIQHEEANRVLEAVRSGPDDFCVPELFYSELVHVTSRKSGRDADFVESVVDAVLGLGLRTLPLTAVSVRRAGRLACEGLAGYDATFVAMAEELAARWLTADERAANIAAHASVTLSAWVSSRRP